MKNKDDQIELLRQINILRLKMIEIGLDKGLENNETIIISRQLDILLLQYQLLALKKK
ncbi:Spo0E family sporulation regulatory protein-aspartic acid phosphatase [Bacillus sp. CGMCC 1.16607]|uniref:Spo0E family sporulation regulatory protein-aspartic acid phosphatase n=1 Tax=Bacillus sp. CGMCC 1.16607 TaxID=3351842 RepID=UPI003625F166